MTTDPHGTFFGRMMALNAGARDVRSTVTATITEKRAPTDESVRLLHEMYAAAHASVVETIPLEGNALHGVVQIVRMFDTDMLRARAVVDINGKRVVAEVKQIYGDGRGSERHALLAALHKELADVLARDILSGALKEGS